MENFIDTFGQFIETHRGWAAPLLGVLAFGESLVLVGLFIPATPMMVCHEHKGPKGPKSAQLRNR